MPAGTLLVLRQVTVMNRNLSSIPLEFNLYETSSTATLVDNIWSSTGGGYFSWEGRIVLAGEQSFSWQSVADEGSTEVDVYLGGYTLSAA